MAGGGGWVNIVPIYVVTVIVFVALERTLIALTPSYAKKRTKNDTEFNKYLHLRFNKAVQNLKSIAGQAVKDACRPQFRPFDSPVNPLVKSYGWDDEVKPYGKAMEMVRARWDHFWESWFHSHFTKRVCDDPLHSSVFSHTLSREISPFHNHLH